jgi:outer membrane immunogenic protein
MKVKFALALGAMMALSALPAKAETKSWTGCYVGAHVGYSFGDTKASTPFAPLPPALTLGGVDNDAPSGGVQVGCDMMIPSSGFVVGVMGDLTFNSDERGAKLGITGFPVPVDVTGTFEIENTYSASGRLGYLITPDALIFVYGGYSWAETSNMSVALNVANITLPLAQISMGDMDGWHAGVGGEYRFTRNVSMTASYRYTDWGSQKIAIGGTPLASVKTEDHNVRLGVNYRF